MDRAALLETLTEDVLSYVMAGGFPESAFAERLQPEGLDDRFADYEMLLRLHFVLDEDVVEFVRDLPAGIRRIETETERRTTTTRGSVEGRIDWSETLTTRASRAPRDSALFVCDDRSETYDTAENVVLKRLISLIYDTLSECASYLENDYEWVRETWRGNEDLIDDLTEIVERNVHVARIRDPETYEPTPRMLERAKQSRTEIYRRAAALVERYQQTLAGDPDAVRRLLNRTAITPDDDHALFELYVLFRFVGTVERLSEGRFTLRTIERGRDEVAALEDGDREFVLYHDNSARDRGIDFVSDVIGTDRDDLSRTEAVQREAQAVADDYFGDGTTYRATGRPDVIVLEVTAGDTSEYLIAEVKYSSRRETIRRGIKETLEYVAFLRDDREYVHGDDAPFGNGWNGVLVTDDLDTEGTPSVEEQESIRILQASELESELAVVLERVLDVS